MGLWGDFCGWLTGRDEKESDVYANPEMVEKVVADLTNVTSIQVENARGNVIDALCNLNNNPSMQNAGLGVPIDNFNGIFDEISANITQISKMISTKAEDIAIYEQAKKDDPFGVFWSSVAMAGAKLGEGILSVGEDLGDGVVSLVGWIAPKDSPVEKWCSEFVQKEWSHDAFNFYYESEFAQKSAFTEDSAISGGFKLIGTTAGYLYLGGAVSGFAGQMKGANFATKAIKTFASSTTKVNTATAFLTGMGSGTESGLRQGLEFDAAAGGGFKQGAKMRQNKK